MVNCFQPKFSLSQTQKNVSEPLTGICYVSPSLNKVELISFEILFDFRFYNINIYINNKDFIRVNMQKLLMATVYVVVSTFGPNVYVFFYRLMTSIIINFIYLKCWHKSMTPCGNVYKQHLFHFQLKTCLRQKTVFFFILIVIVKFGNQLLLKCVKILKCWYNA